MYRIYKDLERQYNNLTEEEKNAIIIYKSSLSFFINELSNIENVEQLNEKEIYDKIDKDLFNRKYLEFANIIDNMNNIVLKYSFFKSIDTTNIYTFIRSLVDTLKILKSIEGKIILSDDLTVYRGVSINNEINEERFNKGEFVSTTLNSSIAEVFMYKKTYNYLYKIELRKGTPVLICPFSIKSHYYSEVDQLIGLTPNGITIHENDSQEEIVLFKNSLLYRTHEGKDIGENNTKIIRLETKTKNEEKENVRKYI